MSSCWGMALSGFTAYWQIPAVPATDCYIGGRIRGILGQALFSQVCPYAAAQCETCALAAYCDYTRVFKPQNPEALPAYVLHDWQVERTSIAVTVLLLGSASLTAENWIRGLFLQLPHLDWWGQAGMKLLRVTDWRSGATLFSQGRFTAKAALTHAQRWPLVAADAHVHFITPLVSKHQHQDPLLAALKTRLQRLRNQFGDAEIFAKPDRCWNCKIQTRRSVNLILGHHQRRLSGDYYRLKLTGINGVGAQLLGAGLWLHAGGQTGLGLGRYRIEIQ